MRKSSAALAALSLALVALTGCTAAPAYDGVACDRAGSQGAISNAVTVDGDFGKTPKVHVAAPIHPSVSSFDDLIVGDGGAITTADQLLTVDMVLFSGNTGEEIITTGFTGDLSRISNIATWSQQFPGLADVLECATAGSRILAVLSPEEVGEAGQSGLGLGKNESVVFVIDVLQAFVPRAEGTPQFHDARGLPTVVRAPDGRPGIIVPGRAAPSKVVSQTLIKGNGETVTADSIVWVNFTAVGWDDTQVLQTTWGATPTSSIASSSPAVAESLVGQPVGSQVLTVVPATAEAPAAVYVVDILGVSPPAPAQ